MLTNIEYDIHNNPIIMTEPRYNLRSNTKRQPAAKEEPFEEMVPLQPETNCIMWSYILYILRVLLPFLFRTTEDLTLTQTNPINRVDSNLDYSSSGSDGEYEKQLVSECIRSMKSRANIKQATKFILYKFATNGILHLEKTDDDTATVSFTTESNRVITIPPNLKIYVLDDEEEHPMHCEPTDDYTIILDTKHTYSIKYNNEEILYIESPAKWSKLANKQFRILCINYL